VLNKLENRYLADLRLTSNLLGRSLLSEKNTNTQPPLPSGDGEKALRAGSPIIVNASLTRPLWQAPVPVVVAGLACGGDSSVAVEH